MFDFTILVLEGAYPTSVSATLGILGAARTLAPRIGAPVPTWRLVSLDGGAVGLDDGFVIGTARLPRHDAPDRSMWIVPGLGLSNARDVHQRFEQADARSAAQAVAQHASRNGTFAASCSGVFLLQAAGLLKGRRATTAWWLAPELARREPTCHVDSDRMICVDGPIVTAGAAFAQADLMLHLLRRLSGEELAEAVSRALIIDKRQAQASFVIPEAFSVGDDLIGRLAARVEAALPDLPSVGDLANEFCMSERTLGRHVKRATGKSTLALLQSIRQRRARTLLESSRLTVEQVAAAVGYQDATALRRLMRRVSGANPSRFRRSALVA